MALKKSISISTLLVPNAYHRISEVYLSKNSGGVVTVQIFADKQAAQRGDSFLVERVYQFDFENNLGSLNSFYSKLKQNVDLYSDAEDD